MTTDCVKANRVALWQIQITVVEELHSSEMWIWDMEDSQGKPEENVVTGPPIETNDNAKLLLEQIKNNYIMIQVYLKSLKFIILELLKKEN